MRKERYQQPLIEEINVEVMEVIATSGKREDSLNMIESDNGAVLSRRRNIWE